MICSEREPRARFCRSGLPVPARSYGFQITAVGKPVWNGTRPNVIGLPRYSTPTIDQTTTRELPSLSATRSTGCIRSGALIYAPSFGWLRTSPRVRRRAEQRRDLALLGTGRHPKSSTLVETAMGNGAGGTGNIAGNDYPLVGCARACPILHRKGAAPPYHAAARLGINRRESSDRRGVKMTSLADGRASFFLAAQFGPGQCISRFATNSNLNGLKLSERQG